MSGSAEVTAADQSAPTRRVPWFPLILAVSLISYTAARMSGLDDRLPYEPGPALAQENVAPGTPDQTLDRLREAFLRGRSACLLTQPPRLHECWPLAGIEFERALRVSASMQQQRPSPLHDAVCELIEKRRAFVLEEDLFGDNSTHPWRYWTYELFHQGGRRRLLVVPIDLAAFPRAR